MSSIKKWLDQKVITPARSLNAKQIGLATAVGFWGGIFPIPACSTFATVFLCSTVLLSMFNPAMSTIAISLNLAVTPLQFFLMPVFLDLPSKIAGLPTCSVSDLITSMKTKPYSETFTKFGAGIFWGTLFWALLAPIAIISIRFIISSLVGLGKKRKD